MAEGEGYLGWAKLVLPSANMKHMKKIPGGFVPSWNAIIAVPAQPVQLSTQLEALGDHIKVKN